MSNNQEAHINQAAEEQPAAPTLAHLRAETQALQDAANKSNTRLVSLFEAYADASHDQTRSPEEMDSLFKALITATYSTTKNNAWAALSKIPQDELDTLSKYFSGLDDYILALSKQDANAPATTNAYMNLWFFAAHLTEIMPDVAAESEAYKQKTGKDTVSFLDFTTPEPDPKTGKSTSGMETLVKRIRRKLEKAGQTKAANTAHADDEAGKEGTPSNYYLQEYSAAPTSPATNFILQAMNTGLKRPMENSATNRHEKIKYEQAGAAMRISRENKSDKVIITADNAQAVFSGKSKSNSKIFCYLLQQMNQQNFHPQIVIDLNEMVDLGMYSRPDAAGRALKKFFDQQLHMEISGEIRKPGRKTPIMEAGGVLFYHYVKRGSKVVLSVNDNFNFDFLAQYYTTFPTFCYKLKSNAFSLAEYIFYLARQNTSRIKKTGSFTISFEAIRQHLGLPTLEEASKTRHYQQDIKDPIEAAIEETEAVIAAEAEKNGDKSPAFTMTPIVNDAADITEWLGGKLEITFNDKFAKTFIEIADSQEKKIADYQKATQKEQAKIAARTNRNNKPT